ATATNRRSESKVGGRLSTGIVLATTSTATRIPIIVSHRITQAMQVHRRILAGARGCRRNSLTEATTTPAMAPNHQDATIPQAIAKAQGLSVFRIRGWCTEKYSTATLAVTRSRQIPKRHARPVAPSTMVRFL